MKMTKMRIRPIGKEPYCFVTSKKGFNTVVTIFALLILVLVFLVFAILFKFAAKEKQTVEDKFSSLEAEFVLKTFLRSPPFTKQTNSIKDLTPEINIYPTNADLVSWTCSANKSSVNYKVLKDSVNNFFDTVYQDEWSLIIVYSNPDYKVKSFGHRGKMWLNDILKPLSKFIGLDLSSHPSMNYFSTYFLAYSYNEKGFGFQIIPCHDGSYSAVMLKARDYVSLKG